MTTMVSGTSLFEALNLCITDLQSGKKKTMGIPQILEIETHKIPNFDSIPQSLHPLSLSVKKPSTYLHSHYSRHSLCSTPP